MASWDRFARLEDFVLRYSFIVLLIRYKMSIMDVEAFHEFLNYDGSFRHSRTISRRQKRINEINDKIHNVT